MNSVKLVWGTPDTDQHLAYIARVSNPNNQENAANQQAPSQSLTQSLLQIKTQFTDSVAAPDAIEHLVASSDTLVSIAIRYYRDASKWTRILRQNNLSSITLVPGTKLKITPA